MAGFRLACGRWENPVSDKGPRFEKYFSQEQPVMTDESLGMVLLRGEYVVDFVSVPKCEATAFREKMRAEGIGVVEVTPFHDVVTKKEVKKDANMFGLLYGWRADLFAKLAECDDPVPRNLVHALNQKHPNSSLHEGMTYRELFALMESVA
jgi:hypothetical protein